MKKIIAVAAGIMTLIFSALSFNANATEPHAGEERHNQKCMSCHKTDVYTRDNRQVKTMSALSNQVDNCMKGAAKVEWTKKQTENVIDYLNSKFYKF